MTATWLQYDIVTGSNPKSPHLQTSCVLVRPSFLKVLCKWASGASWTKCHDIQHKWCTYTILYYCAKVKHNETNIVIIALATLEIFGASCLRHGQKGWPIADEWIGPVTFGLHHPRTTSSDTIQPVRTFTKGSVSPQVDDTSPAKAIHLGIPGHPWNHLI